MVCSLVQCRIVIILPHPLWRHVKRLESCVHSLHFVNARNDEEQTWPLLLTTLDSTQTKDDGPFILWYDFDYHDQTEWEGDYEKQHGDDL